MKLKRYTCKRCGQSWIPRIETKPKRCAICKSQYWDKDRVRAKREAEHDNIL